jgi:hypothetical protein
MTLDDNKRRGPSGDPNATALTRPGPPTTVERNRRADKTAKAEQCPRKA